MSENLKEKLKNTNEGQLSDDDLSKVAGGEDKGETGPEVIYKYKKGDWWSQNVSFLTMSSDYLKIEYGYPRGALPAYRVLIQFWRNGVIVKEGYMGVMEGAIDHMIANDPEYTIASLGDCDLEAQP